MIEIFKLLGTVALDTAEAEAGLERMVEKAARTGERLSAAVDWLGTTVIMPVERLFDGCADALPRPFQAAAIAAEESWSGIAGWFEANVIQPIKNMLNFRWEWPHIPLPHFSISGEFRLVPPSVPTVGIDWYAKAMDSPLILDRPTAFGINGSGQIMAGGEAGSEVVSGADTLMGMIEGAVDRRNERLEAALDGILNLLSEYMPQVSNMQLVTDTGALVGAITPMVDSSMGRMAAHRGRRN